MSTVVVTGGTGLIGTALTGLLTEAGHRVVILTRKPRPASGSVSFEHWDPASGTYPKGLFLHTDAIVHLAGENVGKGRWTAKRKDAIVRSRTESSALLVRALREESGRVRTLVSASGITDAGFLGETRRLWEGSIRPASDLGIRLVILRTGLVLAREGGAFPAFRSPIRAGLAPIFGNGSQEVSWICLQDICRMYLHALDTPSLSGAYNAAAPEVVSNKVMMLKLARKLRGRFYVPVHIPAFILKWILGELSEEILASAAVDVDKIRATGFRYAFPTLDAALGDLCR